MRPAKADAVAVAVLAKAPLPGLVNTRLIPELGAHGAAALQERFIADAVAKACAAEVGPVTLWGTPDTAHLVFLEAAAQHGVALAIQPEADLGGRMLAATVAADGPALVIGADCPPLTPAHLRAAAQGLMDGMDAVVIPAEDGGYVLIGTRAPQPALFAGITWSTATVMDETRRRLRQAGLAWREFAPLWDVDVPADLERLRRTGYDDFPL
jgi:hypothetical protein